MFDCCVNLLHPSFDQDRTAVLLRAMAGGLKGALLCGSDLESSRQSAVMARQLKGRLRVDLYSTAGIHPHQASLWRDETTNALVSLIREYEDIIRASGEMGLDYARNYSSPDAQRRAFAAQLELAAELRIPVFLHQRNSHADFLAILRSFAPRLPAMLVHCFTGSSSQLDDYLDLNCYIGITGWFCDERRGSHLHSLIAAIPQDRLLVETDAPYLIPRTLPNHVRNRNEPSYLAHLLERISDHYPLTAEELGHVTCANAYEFLNAAS